MKKSLKHMLIMGMLSFLLTLNFPSYAANDLSTNEVKQLLVGHTIFGQKKGNTWTILFKPDGTISGTYANESQKGVYKLKDNGQFCRKYKSWQKGVFSCFSIQKNKGHYIAVIRSGPSKSVSFKLKK